MACRPIRTGDAFLSTVLENLDCQAQIIGSYGYQALGQPGSPIANVMTGLLTIFIALFGIRLLLGAAPTGKDIVSDVLKIGIVLTLAFSWPAFRTVIYDVLLYGPAQITQVIFAPSLADNANGLVGRLQAINDNLMQLTEVGTGRTIGQTVNGQGTNVSFTDSELADESAFGYARLLFLISTIGSLGLMRIFAGLLLALAPLFAGMLLFDLTRGLFAGWLRGLAIIFLGSVGITFVLIAELAIVEPWLIDTLTIRQLGYATPASPIEILAMTAAFFLIKFAMLWLLAKVAFSRGWLTVPSWADIRPLLANTQPQRLAFGGAAEAAPNSPRSENQPQSTADREAGTNRPRIAMYQRMDTSEASTPISANTMVRQEERLGTSWRRSSYRSSVAARRRDTQ